MPDYIKPPIEWLARMDPRALLVGLVALGALLAFLPLIASIDRLSRLRVASGTSYLLLGLFLVVLGLAAGVAAGSLHTYRRLADDQLAANVTIRRLGERQFKLSVAAPDAATRDFPVVGDEWQIDARIVKWPRHGAVQGFDTVYRLERLSGRYADVTQERSAARLAHSLAAKEPVDVWVLLRRYHDYLGLIDASSGSTGYVPMAEGAEYAIGVSASGLVVRPANDAARRALGSR
jgi:hypothetical protein